MQRGADDRPLFHCYTKRKMARRKPQNIGLARDLQKQINSVVAKSVQQSAVEIANALAQAGPAWSGEFSSAWDVVLAGATPSPPRKTGAVYSYSKRNFPLKRYEDALNSRIGTSDVIRFEITNSAPHADIAIDEEESIFIARGEPVKDVIEKGFRRRSGDGEQDLGLRPDISIGLSGEEPTSSITAPKYWFQTYTRGGQLEFNLRRGVELGFR